MRARAARGSWKRGAGSLGPGNRMTALGPCLPHTKSKNGPSFLGLAGAARGPKRGRSSVPKVIFFGGGSAGTFEQGELPIWY